MLKINFSNSKRWFAFLKSRYNIQNIFAFKKTTKHSSHFLISTFRTYDSQIASFHSVNIFITFDPVYINDLDSRGASSHRLQRTNKRKGIMFTFTIRPFSLIALTACIRSLNMLSAIHYLSPNVIFLSIRLNRRL